MPDELIGRVALISGGSRNIGRAVALRFSDAGARVALTYNSDAESAEETVRLISERGGTAQAYQATLEPRRSPGDDRCAKRPERVRHAVELRPIFTPGRIGKADGECAPNAAPRAGDYNGLVFDLHALLT